MSDTYYGVEDLAGRTHLVDPQDLRETPLCGYLGDVGPVAPLTLASYLCDPCVAVSQGQQPTRLATYTEGTLDV